MHIEATRGKLIAGPESETVEVTKRNVSAILTTPHLYNDCKWLHVSSLQKREDLESASNVLTHGSTGQFDYLCRGVGRRSKN